MTDGIDLADRAELEHADLSALTARVLASPPENLEPIMATIGEMLDTRAAPLLRRRAARASRAIRFAARLKSA